MNITSQLQARFLQTVSQSKYPARTKVKSVNNFYFWTSHQNADSLNLPESVFTFDATSNSKPFPFVVLVIMSSLLLLAEIVRRFEVGNDFETRHFDPGIRQLEVLKKQNFIFWFFTWTKQVFLGEGRLDFSIRGSRENVSTGRWWFLLYFLSSSFHTLFWPSQEIKIS